MIIQVLSYVVKYFVKSKIKVFEFIKYGKQRTFLSRIDRTNLLKSYFH